VYIKDIINTKSKKKFKKISLDSRNIKKNDLFIPLTINSNQYILDTILKKGLVITDKKYQHKNIYFVKNLNQEVVNIFNKYYHYPLKEINLIGITGTDGKTTLTSILSDMLNASSIGTNGFYLNNKYYPLNNTTPAIDILYDCFNQARNYHYKNIVMEVSSEAYLTNRLGDLKFNIGILTDITKDHLDKHKSLDNYINCKLNLFRNSDISILNHDSKYYNLCKKNSHKSLSYGFNKKANLQIINYKLYFNYSIITFKYKRHKYQIKYNLKGKFNVYNIACSILTLIALNYNINDILKRINNIKQVLGRMDIVYNGDYKIMIDYAHTTKSTLNILKFTKKFFKNIITIVGCAGGRYKEKRKEIGNLVLKYSKYVLFTMDDPRYEDPINIIKEMIGNTKKKNYLIELNRKEAIKKAIFLAKKNYIILILGKGIDNYMLINNQKIPYSDYQTVFEVVKNLK